MKLGLVTSTVLILAPAAFATPQAADKLIAFGREFPVHGFTLSEDLRQQISTYRKKTGSYIITSANWDGFYGGRRRGGFAEHGGIGGVH